MNKIFRSGLSQNEDEKIDWTFEDTPEDFKAWHTLLLIASDLLHQAQIHFIFKILFRMFGYIMSKSQLVCPKLIYTHRIIDIQYNVIILVL